MALWTSGGRSLEALGSAGWFSFAVPGGVSGVAVARTINGEIHSPVVLDWFRQHGVSENQLCDPRKNAQ